METESAPLYEKVIYQNDAKFYQLKLVLNEFRDKQYLHLRKYFLSFDEGYIASREGASMEASMANVFALLDGLLDLVSQAEGDEVIMRYFKDKISDLKSE